MARPRGTQERPPALAVYRRMLTQGEMMMWPYCEWSHCASPAMEVVELCLAADGERLLRPVHVCARHADAVPLPPFRRLPRARP